MEIKEIMIGDLVFAKPSMLPIRLEAVHKKKVGYHVVTHKLNWVRTGLIVPIPITDEILKKNGFVLKRDELFEWYVCGDVSIEYTADARHNDAYWEFGCGNKDCDVSLIVMHYVHELQHALKLCKIDKEIEL